MLLFGDKRSNALTAAVLIGRFSGPIIAVSSMWAGLAVSGVKMNDAYSALLVVVGLLGIILLRTERSDEFYFGESSTARAVSISGSWLILCGVLLLLGYATKSSDWYSRKLLFSWAIAAPLLIFAFHEFVAKTLSRMFISQRVGRRAVIAGASEVGQKIAKNLKVAPMMGLVVDGFFDDRSLDRIGATAETEMLGSLSDVRDYVQSNGIDIVFVAIPMRNVGRVMRLIDELQDTTVSIYFVPDVFVFDLIQSRAIEVMGVHALALCETPFYGLRGVQKRILDMLFSLLTLLLLSPVILAIGVAVRITFRGSTIFKQTRYGLDGKKIVIYKFRTMTVTEDADDIPQARKGDERLTPIGAFLRRYSLDELPQLVNVLQGRMSIVGPRPHAVVHNEEYRQLIKGYMVRHKVPPGMTGLAQIQGYRGETENVEKMKRRIELDLEYLRNWSLALDVRIILKTIPVVLSGRSAY